MSRIKIKNFGPIKTGCLSNDGWLDIKKVTLFIGNQGTGKSTVAKLISTFTWIEKALTRGDYDIAYFESKDRIKTYFAYHKIDEYLPEYNIQNPFFRGKEEPVLEYEGASYRIIYKPRRLKIEPRQKSVYSLPQIMYVPSERNFISTVDDPKFLRIASEPLVELLTEMRRAKAKIIEPINLPINATQLSYDEKLNLIYISGADYKVSLDKGSSGFQSVVPLYLVSWFLANQVKGNEGQEAMNSDELSRFQDSVREIYANPDLNEDQRRLAISAVSYRFKKTAFINIVEEPEQNLFPESQQEILNSLLKMNNLSENNKLIMTSHSPYIINFLTLCVKAGLIHQKFQGRLSKKMIDNIEAIVPTEANLLPQDIVIYEINGNGGIEILPDYNGLPNDENYLNQILEFFNEQFSKLLDIERNAGQLF
jgi:predicted ATPase